VMCKRSHFSHLVCQVIRIYRSDVLGAFPFCVDLGG
jgi:hypothetical protein